MRGADGIDLLADGKRAGATEANRRRRRRVGKLRDGQQAEIARLVARRQMRLHAPSLASARIRRLPHGDCLRAGHDVAVRRHLVPAHDDSAALRDLRSAGVQRDDDDHAAGYVGEDLLGRLAARASGKSNGADAQGARRERQTSMWFHSVSPQDAEA